MYIGKVAYQYKGTAPAKVTVKKGTLGIAGGAFSGQVKVRRIVLPSTIKRIGATAFYRCKALYSINIPNGVTTIGDNTFVTCIKLKTLTIPKSVKKISNNAIGFNLIYDEDEGSSDEGDYVAVKGFKLRGYKGTAAEKYAKKFKISFVKL